MKYRRDIRDSQIRNLRKKVEDADYKKYLVEMTLHKLRAFQGARIRFRFPVTALIGPNSGGKSTILGAAALIYRESKPSQYFAISLADEEAMKGVKISYRMIDRNERKEGEIERSVTHPTGKWSRKALDRKLLYFGVRRTIPANERPEYTKFRTGVLPLTEEDYSGLGDEVLDPAQRILGLDLNRYARSSGKKPLIGYAGPVKFSEFHFGAGISVIIEILWNLENLSPDDQALILIEEVENSLHPYAVRKFVEYLIGITERKRCQVIFTSHSEYALDPLPGDAIWAAREGTLVSGRLRVQDMLAFRGDVDTRLAVFCEDIMAEEWLRGMMRFAGMDAQLLSVEFFSVGSHSDVIKMTQDHNRNPSRRFRAIGFVDGDTPSELDLGKDVFRLPGTLIPEELILDTVREGFDTNLAKLTLALNRRAEEQELVRRVIDGEVRATEDMHLIFNKIGQRLGFLPEETVRLAMITAYCLTKPEASSQISKIIQQHLPTNENANALLPFNSE